MKNLFKLSPFILEVLCIFFLFVSCEKDNTSSSNNSSLNNYILAGDTEYKIWKSHLENEGERPKYHEGYETILNLYSNSYYEDGGNGLDIYISFTMYTETGFKLENGTYSFNNNKPYPTGSFSEGEYEECTGMQDECSDDVEISSGIIVVSESGGSYSITIDCTDENGKEITGSYKGKLSVIDYQGL